MLKHEWEAAAKTASSTVKHGWKSTYQAMTDVGGLAAAEALYQGNSLDKVLTARSSSERHLQLAIWVLSSHNNMKRFAQLRARAWKYHVKERLAELETGARNGMLTVF